MSKAWIYSTTAKGHDSLRALFEASVANSTKVMDPGDGMFERRLADGSGQIALVGSAFDVGQQLVESLQLRLVECRDISAEEGWDAFVYRVK